MTMDSSPSHETLDGLQVNYTIDGYVYHDDLETPVEIRIQHACTTVGGNIVSENHDLTGIMVWPATHLLCQCIIDGSIKLSELVLELGCGCGAVGVAALRSRKTAPSLWISSDMDEHARDLCHRNFCINGLEVDDVGSKAYVRKLTWGCQEEMTSILDDIRKRFPGRGPDVKFNSIVAADIIYPSTCGKALEDLFRTVDTMLDSNGTFWLSFATRDGPRTPSKLIAAASQFGYSISCLTELCRKNLGRLPPLLDSKILILRRNYDARSLNDMIGDENCSIFPGLKHSLARLDDPSSDEEWDAPFSQSEDNF